MTSLSCPSFQSDEGLDLIRESVRPDYQEPIETEPSSVIGTGCYELTEEQHERIGHRSRVLSTKADDVEPAISQLRRGSSFLSILEARRRIDQPLYAVVMEAYYQGGPTRRPMTCSKPSG